MLVKITMSTSKRSITQESVFKVI